MSNTYRFPMLFFIIAAWLFINGFLTWHFGIRTDGESIKYIREANNLINDGKLSSPNFRMYLIPIWLILLSMKLKLGYVFVVIIQLLFSLLATLSIYKLSVSIFNEKIALIASFWFLLILPLHQFNSYLQTDSLFYSFTIIFSCHLLLIKRITPGVIFMLVAGLAIIAITRPNGLFFFAATLLYLSFRFLPQLHILLKIFLPVLFTMIFLYLINEAIGSGGELDFMLPAIEEHIICGVPTSHNEEIETLKSGNSLTGLFYYVANNLSQFSKLALHRSIAFFGNLRSYYNTWHNLYIAIIFYPMYLLVILSIRHWLRLNKAFFFYSLGIIVLTWITVILSCDDWHNRFFLTICPNLLILSLPTINSFIKKTTS